MISTVLPVAQYHGLMAGPSIFDTPGNGLMGGVDLV